MPGPFGQGTEVMRTLTRSYVSRGQIRWGSKVVSENNGVGSFLRRIAGLGESQGISKRDRWFANGCPMPAPPDVKRGVLSRYGDPTGVWVETGTLFGDTTAFLAAGGAAHVYSIEASPEFFEKAASRFARSEKITVLHGLAEAVLPRILPEIKGSVSFWLDGHFSGGETFQGPLDTPIREELAAINDHLERLGDVTILVDDFRCFGSSEFPQYPSKTSLVEWASSRGLDWTVEHDIFIAGSGLHSVADSKDGGLG